MGHQLLHENPLNQLMQFDYPNRYLEIQDIKLQNSTGVLFVYAWCIQCFQGRLLPAVQDLVPHNKMARAVA